MKGTGKTVFSGTRVESFDVEIVGTLPNVGPDQNLILGRCTGGPLAETGVIAGMSGSPVFVDGKLLGAIAYSWGFAKEALAGITPIEEMLELALQGQHEPAARSGDGIGARDLARLRERDEIPAFFVEELGRRLVPAGATAPIPVPLTVSGVGPLGFTRMVSPLSAAGFVPLQGGGAGRAPDPSPTLEPGSAMGLKLARGDVDLTATGTVTWVDQTGILALGHPMFGLGSVDLPLTGARVELLVASLERSARLATPLSEVGAIREDRAAGVYGQIGSAPRMLPVRVQLSGRRGARREYAFDIANDPLLSPLLLYASLNGILSSRERAFGSATLRLREGSVIQLAGDEDVLLDNLFAGPTAFEYATGISAYILYLLMNNDWQPPEIAGVNLLLDYDDLPMTGRIRRASLDRYRVRAGETLEVRVAVSPYRGPERVLTGQIMVPPDTPPGWVTVHVGGALAISRAEADAEPIVPGDFAQFVWLINNLRRNDRVYVAAYTQDSGALLGGARLPNLPPSIASVLSRPRMAGEFAVVRQRGILEEEIPAGIAVEGFSRIQLEVVEP
jgi:hypothetical protein